MGLLCLGQACLGVKEEGAQTPLAGCCAPRQFFPLCQTLLQGAVLAAVLDVLTVLCQLVMSTHPAHLSLPCFNMTQLHSHLTNQFTEAQRGQVTNRLKLTGQ